MSSQEDLDRSDELRELWEEDERRDAAAHNGYHFEDPYADVPPPTEAPDDGRDDLEGAIAHRLQVLRINHEARRRLDEENRPALALPPIKPFSTWIDEPIDPTRWRIDKLAPVKSRTLLAAQWKAGKTSLVGSLIRALADDESFLDYFNVCVPARHLVLLDDELDEDMLRDWLRAQNIRDKNAIAEVIPLRGHVASLDILDDHTRDQWVQRLRDQGCDHLILDCLRPVLDACGLDESRDAGQFLLAYDELLSQAGINDSTVVHHMGHSNERSRGDSRLLDWPDVLWKVVRETDDPASTRYFSAYGRGVNVPEGRLSYDPHTHRISYIGGSRVNAKVEAAGIALISLLAECGEELSGRAIEDALAGEEHSRKAVRDATGKAIKKELVAIKDGARRAKLHRIAYPCSKCGLPVTSKRERHESCPTGTASVEWLFTE
jgi:hypothetical protein